MPSPILYPHAFLLFSIICHRFRETKAEYYVVTRTMNVPLVTYKDPHFCPRRLWVSLPFSAFVLHFPLYYFQSLPWCHSPCSNPKTNTYRCWIYYRGLKFARQGIFLLKGRTVRRGARKLRQCCKDAGKRQDGKVTTGKIHGLPSLSLRKEQTFRMDLRSSQRLCEVGEDAVTTPIFPFRTLKIFQRLGCSDLNVMNDMQMCDLRSEFINFVSFEHEKYLIIYVLFSPQLCEK